ncbi:hypothetical protein Mal4_44740 [Maioricimonas rarisocia]|uniref:BioF2-like acetyltransferase domain-containing protein n=1 Tax=Maioricimonas rarisocia TaxID=2528026 RepID=A0A517ZCD8_9PLAN|nr:GNAT family N-acetyltransferase [Maioricimonas rarisocia]QDU40119.1 hypothetical protein Mal4_44740 [Maioricimonas rarisocia]
MMTYHVQDAASLTDDDWQRWSEIQAAQPELANPFFRPELTRITATIRDDVEVATIRRDGDAVAFFPFQRSQSGAAQPVTGRLSEFHGVIAEPGLEYSPVELLRASGLTSWHFDHLPVSQTAFAGHLWGESGSPYMDLSDGYAAYREAMRKQGSSMAQAERKGRKLAREIGPLRFEYHTREANVFAALVDWKTAQHRRTNVLEVFRTEWLNNLLEALRVVDEPSFAAPLSALYAGDELVAVHLGLCSPAALHIWFPAYNVEYERYSPGLVLLLQMAEHVAGRGVTRVDFGRGEERYKQQFKTGDVAIAEGKVSLSPLRAAAHQAWYHTKRRIRSSPWRRQLEAPLLATRRVRQWLAFR